MDFNHSNSNGSTIVVRTVCAAVFLAFTFLWVYFFQSDLLAVAQHLLSHGQTHYNRMVGAVLITLLLFLLQVGVYKLTGLSKRFHALTYLPSLLLLAVISDVNVDASNHLLSFAWLWGVPLILLVWAVIVWALRNLQSYDKDTAIGLFSRRMWVNLLLLIVMMLGVVSMANTNAVSHYRAHAEVSLVHGQIDEALAVGRRSLETDAHLTMLRAYALSRKGELGERLFQYPVVGGSRSLLPVDSTAKFLFYPVDSLYAFLGARPHGPMTGNRYLQLLEQRGLASPAVKDYILTSFLVDRRLDDFAARVGHYYPLNGDSLPRHYREALVLYKHLRAHPVVTYTDAVVDVDYADLQKLESDYPDDSERKVRVAEKYRGSYWYYYEYCGL